MGCSSRRGRRRKCAVGAGHARPGGVWQTGVCGKAAGRTCPAPTSPLKLKLHLFRRVCRGRIYASRAVYPLYRMIGTAAAGGIYAAPTSQPIIFILVYGRGPGMSGPYAAALSQSSRFVMLFKLTPSVEALWSRADVAGGRMPMAPRTMRVLLKLMIKR